MYGLVNDVVPSDHDLNIRADHAVYKGLENGSTYSGRGERLEVVEFEAGELTRTVNRMASISS
jgi:hypothetical protein